MISGMTWADHTAWQALMDAFREWRLPPATTLVEQAGLGKFAACFLRQALSPCRIAYDPNELQYLLFVGAHMGHVLLSS